MIRDFFQHRACEIGVHRHIKQEGLHPLHCVGPFKRKQKPGCCQDGIFVCRGQLAGSFLYMGDTAWVTHVGPALILVQVFHCSCLGKWVDTGKPVPGCDFHLSATPRVDTVAVRCTLTIAFQHIRWLKVQHTPYIAMQAKHCFLVDLGCAQFRPVVNIVIRRLDPGVVFDLPVWLHFHTGGVVDPDDQWNAVGLFMIDGGKYPLAGCQWHPKNPPKVFSHVQYATNFTLPTGYGNRGTLRVSRFTCVGCVK